MSLIYCPTCQRGTEHRIYQVNATYLGDKFPDLEAKGVFSNCDQVFIKMTECQRCGTFHSASKD